MKDLLTDALQKKLASTLESLGGAKALFGDPVMLGGEQVVPVARIVLALAADAEGAGGGKAGLASWASGGGGGNAAAGIRVSIEPVGYLRATADGPVFCPLDAGAR